jgi:hypothetical protein
MLIHYKIQGYIYLRKLIYFTRLLKALELVLSIINLNKICSFNTKIIKIKKI